MYSLPQSYNQTSKCKRCISSNAYSEPAERFFLEYAQRGKWKIEREYKILKKQFELSKLKVFAEAQLVEFNLLPPEVYKASRKVTNSLSIHNHFWRSTENIALNGFLPSKLKEEGSCVISFCNRTIMITLDHKTILQLINKLETYSLNDIILRGHSYQNTKTFVVLGNNAVHLENAVYEELLDILQDYLKVYSEEYSKFQKYIGAENFSFYKDTNDYMLLETSRENWRKLIQYARKFDTEQGTTSEYCFNSNDHHLLAISAQNNIKFRLLPANSIKNEDSFLFPDDQLCILWEIPDTGSRKAIETGDVWTAQQTYEWLQKLLQQFTDESPDADQAVPGKQRFFRKMLDFFFK